MSLLSFFVFKNRGISAILFAEMIGCLLDRIFPLCAIISRINLVLARRGIQKSGSYRNYNCLSYQWSMLFSPLLASGDFSCAETYMPSNDAGRRIRPAHAGFNVANHISNIITAVYICQFFLSIFNEIIGVMSKCL